MLTIFIMDVRGLLAVFLCLVFVELFARTGCQTHFGQHFIITLPNSTVPGSEVGLVLTNPGAENLTVNCTCTSTSSTSSYTISARNATYERLSPASCTLPASGNFVRTLVLSATAQFGVLVHGTAFSDGYLALPVEVWGRRHVVGTFCHGNDTVCQVVVIASQDYTRVNFSLPPQHPVFQLDDGTFTRAGVPGEILMKNQALVVQRPFELTGSVIVTNASVGVLAGAQRTSYEGAVGGVIEQVPPETALGTEHVTLSQGTVRVVAVEPLTTIHFPDRKSVRLSSSYSSSQFKVSSPTRIRADRPVLVLQFGRLGSGTPSAGSFPFLVILTPRRQFVNGTQPTIVPYLWPNITSTLIVVSRVKSLASIAYSDVTLEKLDAGASPRAYPDYAVVARSVASTSALTATGAGNMATYLQLQSAEGVVLSPLSAGFSVINTLKDCENRTQQWSGDTVDNDCDGQVDEDDCSAGPASDTDCKLDVSGGQRDVWGTQFLFAIPSHVWWNFNMNITLAVTTLSSTPVNVSLHLLDSGSNLTRLTVSLTGPVFFQITPDNASLLFGDTSRSVYQLNSSAEVSSTFYMIGTHRALSKPTSGSMRLLPVDALGREYYVFTPKSTDNKAAYFQIIGAFPDTFVEIRFLLEPQNASVIFDSVVYGNYDVIYTSVDAYLALQISCDLSCTMTGSLISASKPVAVFSISDYVTVDFPFIRSQFYDHLIEQLPPVSSYGKRFITTAMLRTSRFDVSYPDVLYIIASQPNTSGNFSNGSLTEFTLAMPGYVRELEVLNSTSCVLETSEPVLLVQVLPNLKYEVDAAMLTVPAVSQFTGQDVFTTQPGTIPGKDINMTYLVVHCNDAVATQIDIDSQTHNFEMISYLSHVSVFTQRNPGTNHTLQLLLKQGTFGGYVVTHGGSKVIAEDVTALAFTLEQNNLTCETTMPQRGDGVDNDCDGSTDEEPCLFFTLNDTDSDGRYNEDCTIPPEVSSDLFSSDSEVASPVVLDTLSLTSSSPAAASISATDLEGLSTHIPITSVTSSPALTAATLSSSAQTEGSLTYIPLSSALQGSEALSSFSYSSAIFTSSSMYPTTSEHITTQSAFSITTVEPSSVITAQPSSSATTVQPSSATTVQPSSATTVQPSSATTVQPSSATTPLPSSATTPRAVAPSLCACTCPPWVHATTVNSASLSDSIVRELTVNKSDISAVRRKKTSASDERPSAQTFGYFGVVVIVATIVSIIALDSGALLRDFRTLVANCRLAGARR